MLIVASLLVALLAAWIAFDLLVPTHHDLRDFDGHEVGRLETAMWRSYYEHRSTALFTELIELLQKQFHLPFWQACEGAWYAAHSAVVFQVGHSHEEYARALPDLDRYYAIIRNASTSDFNVHRAAVLELDWWIVHRERAQHPVEDLYRSLAILQAEIYRIPPNQFSEHARLRGDAMLIRDATAAGAGTSESDWRRIGEMLDRSWGALQESVRK
jgi:hypothetical protein